jgi:hypothetical protein
MGNGAARAAAEAKDVDGRLFWSITHLSIELFIPPAILRITVFPACR